MNCEADLTFPIFCNGCHTLYPVPLRADYFDLFGLDAGYDIDPQRLATAFRAITRNIHPDRFSGQPETVSALATRLSAQVNQAYDGLRDPVLRAEYLLERSGGPSATEVRDVPGNLLAEVMIIREQLEESRSAAKPEAQVELRTSLTARRQHTLRQIAERAGGLATLDAAGKKDLRKLLNSIKYFDNLLEELAADPLQGSARSG